MEGDEVRCSALVPGLGRRRTDDPPSFSGASRSSWRRRASSASSSPLPSPWSSLLSWPCECPLSSLCVRISSNLRTLNNFGGLVDSEGRFSPRIYEFSNTRVAVSPQFSWFRKLLCREMQLATLCRSKIGDARIISADAVLAKNACKILLRAIQYPTDDDCTGVVAADCSARATARLPAHCTSGLGTLEAAPRVASGGLFLPQGPGTRRGSITLP